MYLLQKDGTEILQSFGLLGLLNELLLFIRLNRKIFTKLFLKDLSEYINNCSLSWKTREAYRHGAWLVRPSMILPLSQSASESWQHIRLCVPCCPQQAERETAPALCWIQLFNTGSRKDGEHTLTHTHTRCFTNATVMLYQDGSPSEWAHSDWHEY